VAKAVEGYRSPKRGAIATLPLRRGSVLECAPDAPMHRERYGPESGDHRLFGNHCLGAT
jgi:hypothetical protein